MNIINAFRIMLIIIISMLMLIIRHIILISTKKGTATAVPIIAKFAREEAAAVFAATDENILVNDTECDIVINSFINMQPLYHFSVLKSRFYVEFSHFYYY